MTRISKRWQNRIIDSVRWTERQPIADRERGRVRGVVPGPHPLLMVASADIEHDTIGTCRLAVGQWSPVSLVASTSAADEVEVFNGREKIWSGSRVLACWPSFQWTASTMTGVWYADRAWSATRIRGTASAAVAAGATGSLSSVVAINGHYPSASATFYLPTAFVSVQAGVVVWAELVFDPVGGTSRWEAYSADCDEAGG